MTEEFDYLVIGGGSGGIASARRAAQHGARVAVIEGARMGGTCVNVGCVPKKLMWHAGQLAHGFADAADYGFDIEGWAHDWPRLVAAREAYLRRLNGIYEQNLQRDRVKTFAGWAKFASANEVICGDTRLRANKILIAVGGQPSSPEIPGAELGIDSNGFFALKQRPATVTIVGSGYIAVELAGVLQAMGSQVNLVYRRERVLRHFDAMLGDTLLENMRAAGIKLYAHSVPLALEGAPGDLNLALESGESLASEALLWAIGRRPATQGLDLAEAEVSCDQAGHIVVDDEQRSSQLHIFAVGDCTNAPALTPVAIAAGRRLADRLFASGPLKPVEVEQVPSVVFSHPPIGSMGLSEDAAVGRYGEDQVRVYQGQFRSLYYGLVEHKVQSAVKLVCVGAEEKVVGLHSIGPGSDELLQGFAVAIRMGATKADFDDTIAIHPTVSEEFVTLR